MMKPSSSEWPAADPQPTAGAAEPDMTLARFDTPLGAGPFGKAQPALGWAHPEVQRQIADASEKARGQARSLGYAAGWAEGRRAAAEAAVSDREALQAETDRQRAAESAQLRRAVHALAEAARNAEQTAAPAWAELADVITDGALAIARAALGRELQTVSGAVLDTLRTAMHRLGEPQTVAAHLHPADLALVEQVPDCPLPEGLKLVADSDVPRGGATVQTPTQRLRMALPVALAKAEEVLRG
jgi:flagellar assembly protein FliH